MKKPKPRTTVIVVRVTQIERQNFLRLADYIGVSLSAWIRMALREKVHTSPLRLRTGNDAR